MSENPDPKIVIEKLYMDIFDPSEPLVWPDGSNKTVDGETLTWGGYFAALAFARFLQLGSLSRETRALLFAHERQLDQMMLHGQPLGPISGDIDGHTG